MNSQTKLPTGKNVVVTGVSSGIGKGIARFLASKAYRVFGSVRKEADAADLRADFDGLIQPLVFDVCDGDAVRESAAFVRDAIGDEPLCALVNNAGLALFGPLEHIADDAFEHIMRVNVLGARVVTNAFLPLLRKDSKGAAPAKIINISSLSGIFNTPMNGAYCVSKHAMESLGEIYRRELYATNVDVVSIRSGPIQSEIWRKNLDDEVQYDGTIYEGLARSSQAIMRGAQKNALPAEMIAQLVWDIIEGRKKRTGYDLGKGAGLSRLLSASFMPKRLVDGLINRSLNKKTI